jgi:pre-mRNA cleavage complex 2 protein Pcf11
VKPEMKLPVLYLVDSIVKNYGRAYTQLFTQNIVSSFCSVFEKVLFIASNGKANNKKRHTHFKQF